MIDQRTPREIFVRGFQERTPSAGDVPVCIDWALTEAWVKENNSSGVSMTSFRFRT